MTKKQKQLLSAYWHAECVDLDDAYGRYSNEKARAYEWCEQKRQRLNGYLPFIPSHNTFQFTYAFLFEKTNEDTGVVEMWLDYETSANSYQFMVTDDPNMMSYAHIWQLL